MGWIVSMSSLPPEVFSHSWATDTVEKGESQVTKVFCVTNTVVLGYIWSEFHKA